MKNFVGLVVIAIFICNGLLAQPRVNQRKPNFLFIVVDDLGYSDLGFMGSKYYETPNIDRLAKSGMIFTNGYANSAVCSPSRASLLTGTYTAHHGITDYIGAPSGEAWREQGRYTKMLPADYGHHLPVGLTTIPEVLKQNDYTTFFAGKWHLGGEAEKSLPTDHGFDINKGGNHAGGPYTGGYFSPFNNPYLDDDESEKGMSYAMKLAKETSVFLKENSKKKFMAMLSFYEVHAPIQTSEVKWMKYRSKAESMDTQEEGFEMEKRLPIRKYQDNPVYAGLVEQMDDAVGYVLNTLDELQLDQNTVVIFVSDNGGVASGDAYSTNNSPLRGGKGYQWEGGIRIPMIIRVPWMDHKANTNTTPVTMADFLPTIIDMVDADVNLKSQLDGMSLYPLLEGKTLPDRTLFWHYPHYGNQGGDPNSMAREGDWKLIHYWEDGHNELYNLKNDLNEQRDLSNQFPEKVEVMWRKLHDWLDQNNAKYALPDPLYDENVSSKKETENKITRKDQLEKSRKEMLNKNWKPNDDWWGSATGQN